MGGIVDTFGLLARLRPWLTSIERARSLNAFRAARGHILRHVPSGQRGYFDAHQLATFFSFVIEEAEGVHLDHRYDGVLCIGPAHTAYGARILPAADEGSEAAAGWAASFAESGLVIEKVEIKQLEAMMNSHELDVIAAIDFPNYEFDAPAPAPEPVGGGAWHRRHPRR
jgi:hypothetical protein